MREDFRRYSMGLGVLVQSPPELPSYQPNRLLEVLANEIHLQFEIIRRWTCSLGLSEVRASGSTDHPHGEIRDTRKRDQLRRRCRKAEVRPPKLRQDKEALDQVLSRANRGE